MFPVAWINVFQVFLSGGQQQFYPKTSTVPGGGNGKREDNRTLVEVTQNFQAWISNYIHVWLREMITHPYPNFNDGLDKPPSQIKLSELICHWSRIWLGASSVPYHQFDPSE